VFAGLSVNELFDWLQIFCGREYRKTSLQFEENQIEFLIGFAMPQSTGKDQL